MVHSTAPPEERKSQLAELLANRYAFIFRVHNGKRPETRERNAAKFVAMMARGEKLHPGPAPIETVATLRGRSK